MAIVCLDWQSAHLHGDAWMSHHRLRYRVFVKRAGWDVRSHDGLEFDQFDTPAAKYIIWTDEQGEARGIVRLLSTTQPYMIETLWPDLATTLPRHPSVWEATRFGCDKDLPVGRRRRVVADLVFAAQQFAVDHGISRYIAVMPVRIVDCSIRALGCPARRLGQTTRLGGHEVAAVSIGAGPDILAGMRRCLHGAGHARPDKAVAAVRPRNWPAAMDPTHLSGLPG